MMKKKFRLEAIAAVTVAGALLAGIACSPNGGSNSTDSTVGTTTTSTASTSQPATSSYEQTASTKEMTVADLAAAAGQSVVRIETDTGIGSGFVVDSDGYLVTNYHVIEDARSITVMLADGSEYDATVTGSDARSDLAVLKISATGLPALEFANLDDVVVGQDVVAIGYALDLEGGEGAGFSVTTGIVSAKNRGIEESSTILGAVQTDAAINHGNSGGPLLTRSGLVVGVNTAVAADSSSGESAFGIAFAVGSDMVKAVYETIRADGQVNRGVLGIANFSAVRPADVAELGLTEGTTGVILGASTSIPTSARPGAQQQQVAAVSGAAAQAGLQSGDVITKIGDSDIENEGALAIALIEHKAGETVTVEFYRDGTQQTVQVTLGSASNQG